MAVIRDRDNRLGLEDVLRFAQVTATNTDEGVVELNRLYELQKAKNEELQKDDVSDYSLSPQERLDLIRKKNEIRDELKQLERNIRVVRERTLTLERSNDINQEVASWLLDEEVNYRKTERVADKGDIAFEVEELKARLVWRVRQRVLIREVGRYWNWKRILALLFGLLLLLLIIFLLLRSCSRVNERRVPFISVKPIPVNLPGAEIDLASVYNSIDANRLRTENEKIVFIPYRDADVPSGAIDIDYFLAEGDIDGSMRIIDSTMMADLDRNKTYSLEELISSYMGEELYLANKEKKEAELPSVNDIFRLEKERQEAELAAQKAAEEARLRGEDLLALLGPDDEFYDIKILNDVAYASKRDSDADLIAGIGDYYDIDIVNEADPSQYSYDIIIENDGPLEEALIAARKAEQERQRYLERGYINEDFIAKGDEWYDLLIFDDERSGNALSEGEEILAAEGYYGWSEYYDIDIVNDIRPKPELLYTGSVEELLRSPEEMERISREAERVTEYETNTSQNITNLYRNYEVVNEAIDKDFMMTEIRRGTPVDFAVYLAPYTFNALLYPYNVITTEGLNETTGSIHDFETYQTSSNNHISLGTYALSAGIMARWRFINTKTFNLFIGLRASYMYSFSPSMSNIPLFAEIGVGMFGFNVYLNAGGVYSGVYNNNLGLGFGLGVEYDFPLSAQSSLLVGINGLLAFGEDDSDVRQKGGGIKLDTSTLNVSPYIGYKVAFDYIESIYKKENRPQRSNQYRILVGAGEGSNIDTNAAASTLEKLRNILSDEEMKVIVDMINNGENISISTETLSQEGFDELMNNETVEDNSLDSIYERTAIEDSEAAEGAVENVVAPVESSPELETDFENVNNIPEE